MVLKRKIYEKLLTWKKETRGTKAILIEGARRIGKSTICEEFGKNEYSSYVLIDFAKQDKTIEGYFNKYLSDLDTLFMMLSTHFGVKLHCLFLMKFKCFRKLGRQLNIWWLMADMIILKRDH